MTIFSTRMARTLRAFAATALIPVAAAAAHAQALPPAKDLIARWAKETNAEGWKTHKSARMKATFDLPAMGMSANMETVTIYPGASASKIDLPGMGEMRQGFNGDVAWSMNPMAGPTVMTGPQLDAAKEDANPSNYSRITPAIVSSETVEKATLNGQECYKVKHTWKSGKTSLDCFSATDGMIVWSQAKQATPQGEIEVTTNYSGYKDWGGVKRATTMSLEQMGQQFVITVQGWEWDNVDPKELELPAEIKTLVEKK
jgi:hypothetical protein